MTRPPEPESLSALIRLVSAQVHSVKLLDRRYEILVRDLDSQTGDRRIGPLSYAQMILQLEEQRLVYALERLGLAQPLLTDALGVANSTDGSFHAKLKRVCQIYPTTIKPQPRRGGPAKRGVNHV
jgi:hypothetical protein